MSFKEAAESGNRSDMEEGYHLFTVKRCLRERKDGSEFRTAKGPFLLVIFADENDDEAAAMYFLTEKAQWKISRDLQRLGVDLDELDQSGATLSDFEHASFAETHMEGRTSYGYATPNGKFTDIELLPLDKLPVAEQERLGGISEPPVDPEGEQPDPSEPAPSTPETAGVDVDDDDLPF